MKTDITTLFRSQYNKLVCYIRSRLDGLSGPADAEDLLQECFAKLLSAANPNQPIADLGAYLFSMVRNRIYDRFRNKRIPHLDVTDTNDPASTEGDPERLFADQAMRQKLYDAIDKLPYEQRSVLVQHVYKGRSFKQIAADTGIPLNTLLARKRYAVQKLRLLLADKSKEE